MDINFPSFKLDIASFEKIWKQARKNNDRSKMAAVLNAFANNLQKSQEEIRRMADSMSQVAMSDIMDEIKKA